MVKTEFNQRFRVCEDGKNLFVDERGAISNHELTEPINLIGMIESKKGTIRANHYHFSKNKNVYLLKGQIIDFSRHY